MGAINLLSRFTVCVAFSILILSLSESFALDADGSMVKGKRNSEKLIKPPQENRIVIETNKKQNIEDLLLRFRIRKDVTLAETISEEYFQLGEYEKSLEWALNANRIDSSSEYAWVLYAKSQVKLGDKETAIKTLNIFLEYRPKAQSILNLLEWIKSGEYE